MNPLSFLNGAFLAALGAAALPVLIHLLSRRRAREVPFAQVRFLDEITRRKVRRLRLRQWLLLLLRTLAIACLALALSRPVWHGPGAARQRGSSTVAIVIDDSYSLEARLDPQALLPVAGESALAWPTRFSEARRRALEVIDLLEQGDRAILVFAGDPVQMPYESSVRDPGLLREEIERAEPRPVRANLAAALERVRPLLAGARTLNRELYIISDFPADQIEELLELQARRAQPTAAGGERQEAPGGGRGEATGDERGGASGGGRGVAPLLPIPPDTRVYLVPVDASATGNVALLAAGYEPAAGGGGGRVTARLRNHGGVPVAGLRVQAFDEVSGRLLAEGFADLGAEASGQVLLTLSEPPASGRLRVESESDLLERDNVRFVSTRAAQRLSVLLVLAGPLSDPRIAAEARFPLLALDPWREAGEGAGGEGGEAAFFDVETVTESDLGLASHLSSDLVVLLDVGRLSQGAGELLARFREEGGGVFIALGERTDARLFNTQVLPGLAALRLENIEGDEDPLTHFTLRPVVAGHEIFEGFPIAPGGALGGAAFQHIVGVRPGPATRTLAEFTGNRPALVEEPGVLLFASALDLSWSDFPTSAAYLPFLHRALLHLARDGRTARGDLLVGSPLSLPLPAEGAERPLAFVGPEGLTLSHAVNQTERGPRLLSAPVPEPGFYALTRETLLGGSDALEVLAANVDPREGALAPMRPEQGEILFGADAVTLAPEGAIDRAVLAARYGRELWRLCLAFAIGLLIAESLIARGRLLG